MEEWEWKKRDEKEKSMWYRRVALDKFGLNGFDDESGATMSHEMLARQNHLLVDAARIK